ncbi:Transcriptional regulator, TetR family protein [Enhygromyxa salina]|uniref:Transcriptional regulator, TetR family protein n=1 Tax=Enhygromyxa salina TaxID=215803 RepID=A0A0C2CZI1_9BACT|nr:TetR family transcriptional regulator [Enhygromyxa salina]KIG13262.1 Transcriptional regulator, TetR family protein [Enhygromyxa salina]
MPDLPFVSNPVSSDPDVACEPTTAEPQAPAGQKLSIVALRERKKDQTREALALAAFTLFQSKGYEATTVAEIARAAEVSRRTFFRYYATKDALLFVDNSDNLERFKELLATLGPDEDSFAHVRRASLALAKEYMRDRDQILARARIIESSPVLSKQERQQDMLWEQAIAESLLAVYEAPTPIAQRRARMLAGATFGAMRATMIEWHNLDGLADLPRLMREALDLFGPKALDHESQPPNPAAN